MQYIIYKINMTNWKSITLNPPASDCHICLKVGDNYETYLFQHGKGWSLYKYPKTIQMSLVPSDALYIILDDIL